MVGVDCVQLALGNVLGDVLALDGDRLWPELLVDLQENVDFLGTNPDFAGDLMSFCLQKLDHTIAQLVPYRRGRAPGNGNLGFGRALQVTSGDRDSRG